MKKVLALIMVLAMAFSLVAGGSKESKEAAVPAGPQSGGVLKIAVNGDASSMLAYKLRGPVDRVFGCVIFEKLLNFDENGDPVPFLLESYEQDPENLTYTLHVRKGVKFHDGSDLNAEVVKWNLDIYKDRGAQNNSFLGNMESVEVIDEYTCVMHLSQWDALIPFYMAREGGCGYVMSKEAFEKNGEEWCMEHAVTTGPFKLVEWKHDEGAVLEKNPDYWRGEPYLDGVEINIYRENSTLQAAFLTGDVHAVMNTATEVADFLREQGFVANVGGIPSNCYTIAFESAKEDDPFHDIRVRQAACYAMDRDIIAKALFGDYGQATNQYARVGATYYNDEVEGYPYNPEKAKELLAEAGYPNGFSTVIWANSSTPISSQLGQIVIEELGQVGIKAELKLIDNAGYTTLIDGWDGGMLIHGMGMDAGVPAQIAGSYAEGLTSGIGHRSFDRPENLGQVIAEGCASDNAGLIEKFKEAQKIIFQDSVLLNSICVSFPIAITSPDLHDAEIGATVSTSCDRWDAWLEQ